MTTFPTMTDLNVFMDIQGLLSTDREESLIYPSITRWFYDVEELTNKFIEI